MRILFTYYNHCFCIFSCRSVPRSLLDVKMHNFHHVFLSLIWINQFGSNIFADKSIFFAESQRNTYWFEWLPSYRRVEDELSRWTGPVFVKLARLFINLTLSIHLCSCAYWRVKVQQCFSTVSPVIFNHFMWGPCQARGIFCCDANADQMTTVVCSWIGRKMTLWTFLPSLNLRMLILLWDSSIHVLKICIGKGGKRWKFILNLGPFYTTDFLSLAAAT